MSKEINPFIVTGKIEPEYFCDRVNESVRLIKLLVNGRHASLLLNLSSGISWLRPVRYRQP